jgi:hypothetical protein
VIVDLGPKLQSALAELGATVEGPGDGWQASTAWCSVEAGGAAR